MSTTTSSTTTPPPAPFTGVTLSSICSLLWRPYLVTGLYRDLLTKHFAQAPLAEEPTLRHLLWKPDEGSDILIESFYSWTPNQGRLRPAVIIKRNTFAAYRRGIGDNSVQGNPLNLRGERRYSLLWAGSHTLFCIGGNGLQAELLGMEVQRFLTEFGPAIREQLGFQRLEVLQHGEVFVLEEAKENCVVPVTVGVSFEENWFLGRVAPRLRGISLSALCGL